MQSGKTYVRLAIAGAATAALVTGCGSSASNSGGGSAGSSQHALLAASVDKTLAAKNAKVRLDFKGSFSGQDLTFGGDGVADFVGKKFQLSLTLPAISGVSGTIEERVIGKDIYLKLPAAETSATGGKPWTKINTSDVGASSTGLDQLGQDPTQFLTTLRSVSDSVTKVGTQDIRGVKTTHYRAQVDLTKAAAASGADTSALDQYKKLIGTNTLPEDVYVDDNGLARRFSVSIAPALPAATASPSAAEVGAFSITVDLYDFGNADTAGIVAPPASDIGELSLGATSG